MFKHQPTKETKEKLYQKKKGRVVDSPIVVCVQVTLIFYWKHSKDKSIVMSRNTYIYEYDNTV